MGFTFRRSFKAGPFRATLSKSGISYSAGAKGVRVTKRANGRTQTTLSTPTRVRRVFIGPTQPQMVRARRATIALHPDRIEITRWQPEARQAAVTRIPWVEVVNAEFVASSLFRRPGYVQILTTSAPLLISQSHPGNELPTAAAHPNVVLFSGTPLGRRRQKAFIAALFALVRTAPADPTQPAVQDVRPAARQTGRAAVSVADELLKLKGLLDAGVLSPAEFEQAKVRLLG